jgi:hypothetical protein
LEQRGLADGFGRLTRSAAGHLTSSCTQETRRPGKPNRCCGDVEDFTRSADQCLLFLGPHTCLYFRARTDGFPHVLPNRPLGELAYLLGKSCRRRFHGLGGPIGKAPSSFDGAIDRSGITSIITHTAVWPAVRSGVGFRLGFGGWP